MFGWRPKDFWQSTVAEFISAIDRWNASQRIGPEPMTFEEFEDLAEIYDDPRSIRSKQKAAKHG